MLTCEACRTYGWPSRHGDRMLGLFLEATSPATASTTARKAVTPDMNLTRSQSEVGVPVAQAYSGGRSVSTPYSCVQLGVASGLRGGMIGAAFGGVFAISSASGSSQAVLTHVAQAAARNAAGFASWTAMYGFTKCELVKIRRTNDILNPAIAGFITGGVLSLATMPRGYWRYGQMQILQNAGGSAVIAVVFDIVNRL
jgi:Tim17/Tim22/Tim23/Pmp24 family